MNTVITDKGGGKNIIYLWSTRRQNDLDIFNPDIPSNQYFGAREIAEYYSVMNIAPAGPDRSVLSRLLKYLPNGIRYVPAILRYVAVSRSSVASVTYVTKWATIHSFLRLLNIVQGKMIFMNLANDIDLSTLNARKIEMYRWAFIYSQVDVVQFISNAELKFSKKIFPQYSDKFFFFPTRCDVHYYRSFISQSLESTNVVAVGNDKRRDWHIVVKLAERGIPFTVLTAAKHAREIIEAAPKCAQNNIRLEYGRSLKESTQIMKNAKCLFLSTYPNERFSGSTSVGVAASLQLPLVLDEPYELDSYGLKPGENCEWFKRGDPDSAEAALRRILDDCAYAGRLAKNIGVVANHVSMERFAKFLMARISEL